MRLRAVPHPHVETIAHLHGFQSAAAKQAEQESPDQGELVGASDSDLYAEFAVAAAEIGFGYRLRVLGLRRNLSRSERAAEIRAAKHWRAAALLALRREFETKQHAFRIWRKARAIAQRKPQQLHHDQNLFLEPVIPQWKL